MIVLGISESHESHACIVRDGKLLAAMAEERLSRLKADSGYPRLAIDSVLSTAGISPEEIDMVVFAAQPANIWHNIYNKTALFSVRDWATESELYWKPVFFEGKSPSIIDAYDAIAKDTDWDFSDDPYYPMIEEIRTSPREEWAGLGSKYRAKTLADHIGIAEDKITYVRHEECHQAYGHFSIGKSAEKTLIFTAEGGGDDSSATVSIGDGSSITEVWKSNDVQIGRLYRYITLLLGMKPNQHEYKVMGLAPYGNAYHGQRSLDYFRTINKVDGTEIVKTQTVKDLYHSSIEALSCERFDGIAWALQTYIEEILCEWITNNCHHYGIDNVVFSGGVSQNIKACKLIAELPEVRKLTVAPISGDGSLGIGAAWRAISMTSPEEHIDGVSSIYLGSESETSAIDQAIEKNKLAASFTIIENPTPEQSARWLEEGNILARYAGRMEFGQRALGNRSIIADPRHWDSVDHINSKIKYRDFWMPFTPSMMYEEVERLIENPKNLYSPHMTMAFDLKKEFRDCIPAAQHPSDKTIRPQMLKRHDNPGYYDIISAFKERTGLGVVLNTSFNLHGEPIVESPEDAVSTFLRSEIDVLLFDHIAIIRSDAR
jgi:carbamoyltransferase